MLDPKGSVWRKWDLHVHTPGTNKADNFESKTLNEFCITMFQKALENDISAIGITDYFCIENYRKVKEFVLRIDGISEFSAIEKDKIRSIFILPNVELRMMPSTDKGRLVNIHCLINPDYEDALENDFFGNFDYSGGPGKKFKMNKQGFINLGKSIDSTLADSDAYKRGINNFVVDISRLQQLMVENKNLRENVIIVVSNSNKDGASALQKHYDLFEGKSGSSLEGVRKSIYENSDCIFSGNPKDIDYFSGQGVDTVNTVKQQCGSLKPCIHGSDAHTEEKLFAPDDNRNCWIKADLTFNGLKQIIYEPKPGQRVAIGPLHPDQKDNFKVINRITFSSSSEFPGTIEVNSNLTSIIGSRSSGKSALLAYIADSIDRIGTRERIPGPGDGFSWDKVDFDYHIEWANKKTNAETPGKLVYIPQNYLYHLSQIPTEIKEKIKPVIASKLPEIDSLYTQSERAIENINLEVVERVSSWFESKEIIEGYQNELKDLGSEKALKDEKEKTDNDIQTIKDSTAKRVLDPPKNSKSLI